MALRSYRHLSALVLIALSVPCLSQAHSPGMIGVNLAGTDMPRRPGVQGEAYIKPVGDELRYYRSKHIRLFRIPFYWESMQGALNAPLDAEELRRIDAIVDEAAALKLQVILDVHSYDRHGGKVLGTDPALDSAFANLWLQLATHYRDRKGIFGYGLMNEPHDTGGTWPHTAQLAIDTIRSVDRNHTILLAGDQWSSAIAWPEANPHLLEVKDPAGKLIYEGHVYFDADATGTYKHNYDEEKAYPDIGVERVKPFVEWLKKNRVDGLIGEFGVPGDDARWNIVLDRFLAYLHQERIPAIYWAGGPLWHHYAMSSEPTAAGDAPQMQVLVRYAKPAHKWWFPF